MKIDALRRAHAKTILVMKLTLVLLTAALFSAHASGVSQTITLAVRQAPLEEVFDQIKKQTGYYFLYTQHALTGAKPVTMAVRDMPVTAFLDKLFEDQPLVYTIASKTITISPKPVVEQPVQHTPADTTIAVSGRVADNAGKYLVNANIKVRGSSNGAITNNEGRFTLQHVPPNAVLEISFVGHEPQVIHVKGQRELIIKLAPKQSVLDETVIIAYGTTTKRLNTGDVTTITAKEIQKNPVINVMEAIRGRVPGLFIQQATGQPGGAFSLRLRNAANFSGSGAPPPLIVVDGVTYPGGTLPMSTGKISTKDFLQGGSGLNYLNPNDIESINILKDADATSLYGSQGAYGVVLITTKKAKPGPVSFNANFYTGVSVLGSTTPLMNTQEYLMLRREALKNDGSTVGAGDIDINGTWPEDRYNDYRKDLLGNYAQTSNLNLSFSGGSNNTSYLIGGSLRNNGNIQRHKGSSTDGSLRFALNTATNDNKLSLSLSATYLSSVNDMVPMDFSQDVILRAPNAPSLFLPDGSINWEGGNDVADDINRMYRNVTNNLLGSINLIYKPVKNLILHTDLSYNNIAGKEFMGYPTTTKPPAATNAAADATSVFHHYNTRNITMSPYAEYHTIVGSKGDINVKLGGRIDNNLNYWDEIEGQGFPSDALLSNPSVGTRVTTRFNETPYRDIGAYAIMKFIWDQKYIINLNGRRDGSTKFGPGKKFGNFGSVAGAWIFSEEKFIKERLPFVSYGKIRASTGLVGGDAVGDFAYLSTYSAVSGTYAGNTALIAGNLSNPILSWEKNRNSEIGLELSFFNDRVYLEGNYYRNIASNQLLYQPLSSVTGFGGMPVNSDAVIRTSGWEASFNTTNIKSKNFSWSTSFNISIPTSKLVKMPVNTTLDPYKYQLGKPVTGMMLFNYAGINPQTGYFNFTNAAGETSDFLSLDDKDKTAFRDLAPRYYGGFQNSFRYKEWSLDIFFTYTSRLGRNILSQNGFPVGYVGLNGPTVWLNRWQKPGDITDVPRISADFMNWGRYGSFTSSTGAYTDATYARLQNLSLRYNVKGSWLSTVHLKDLNVYLQGQNLLTISKFDGLDPENLSVSVIPPMRVFTAGINCTF